jgi:DNA-binding transcriptional LysR family regulator
MDLRQLEVFGAVMKAGTTIGAAHLLSISQPSVSNALRRLEDSLGFDLFDRVQGRLQPTDEARILYQEVQDIFTAFDKTRQVVDEIRQDRRGHLRIAATPVIGNSLLPRTIGPFVRSRPSLKVSLEIEKLEDVLDKTSRGEVDIGIAINPYASPTLRSHRICSVRMVCVMLENHPLSAKRTITPPDLADQTLVSFAADTVLGRLIDAAFVKQGMSRQINLEVRYCETACLLAETCGGVAIVDQFAFCGAMTYPHLVFREFSPSIEVGAYLLVPRFRRLSRVAERFVRTLRNELKTVEAELRERLPASAVA